jgi:hypothetical protein
MGCRTLIGVAEPDGRYTARHLHRGDHPDHLLPVLRTIWRQTFHTDTDAMLTALLARDWSHLVPDPALPPPTGTIAVPGVGCAPHDGARRPAHHGRILGEATGGDREWLYLIDRVTDEVSVYEATVHERWLLHSRHPLIACTTAHP